MKLEKISTVSLSQNNPTNIPRGFHVKTTWKRTFPRRFSVESMWCVCREFLPTHYKKDLKNVYDIICHEKYQLN